MFYIDDRAIERFIKEDVPYMDLTTHLLEIGQQCGVMTFTAREDMVLACTEEAVRLLEKLNIDVIEHAPSGTAIQKGETFIVAKGRAEDLHAGWKISLSVLEYCCSIATRTRHLVEAARLEQPDIAIVTTRKCIPGTREIAMKSILAGNGLPHRLGLSETILIFQQHMNFFSSMDDVAEAIRKFRKRACEKKILIEASTEEEALRMVQMDIDGLQLDKIPVEQLASLVQKLRQVNSKITLIATGGVRADNVAAYAATGVDAIATSSVYFGRPADIKVSIEPC